MAELAIRLEGERRWRTLSLVQGGERGAVPGAICPHCGAVLVVRRAGEPEVSHHTVEARAACFFCGEGVGTLRLEVSTLFGIEEDLAVKETVRRLGGRVY